MNIKCKLFGHNWHALDFIDFGWDYKFCPRCEAKNYQIKDGVLSKIG